MTLPTAYHQLGKFIVDFQHVETAVSDLLCLLAEPSDSEAISILINELDYSERLKSADVLFARFIDLKREADLTDKTEFHKLIVELGKLGERRNDLVHSKYMLWVNIEGNTGLVRENSKLKGNKGMREQQEEELLPEAFNSDLKMLLSASQNLEKFRLKVIDYLYPDVIGK